MEFIIMILIVSAIIAGAVYEQKSRDEIERNQPKGRYPKNEKLTDIPRVVEPTKVPKSDSIDMLHPEPAQLAVPEVLSPYGISDFRNEDGYEEMPWDREEMMIDSEETGIERTQTRYEKLREELENIRNKPKRTRAETRLIEQFKPRLRFNDLEGFTYQGEPNEAYDNFKKQPPPSKLERAYATYQIVEALIILSGLSEEQNWKLELVPLDGEKFYIKTPAVYGFGINYKYYSDALPVPTNWLNLFVEELQESGSSLDINNITLLNSVDGQTNPVIFFGIKYSDKKKGVVTPPFARTDVFFFDDIPLPAKSPMQLEYCAGIDDTSGVTLYNTIAHHNLIIGQSESGKSVTANTILATAALTRTSNNLRLWITDSKGSTGYSNLRAHRNLGYPINGRFAPSTGLVRQPKIIRDTDAVDGVLLSSDHKIIITYACRMVRAMRSFDAMVQEHRQIVAQAGATNFTSYIQKNPDANLPFKYWYHDEYQTCKNEFLSTYEILRGPIKDYVKRKEKREALIASITADNEEKINEKLAGLVKETDEFIEYIYSHFQATNWWKMYEQWLDRLTRAYRSDGAYAIIVTQDAQRAVINTSIANSIPNWNILCGVVARVPEDTQTLLKTSAEHLYRILGAMRTRGDQILIGFNRLTPTRAQGSLLEEDDMREKVTPKFPSEDANMLLKNIGPILITEGTCEDEYEVYNYLFDQAAFAQFGLKFGDEASEQIGLDSGNRDFDLTKIYEPSSTSTPSQETIEEYHESTSTHTQIKNTDQQVEKDTSSWSTEKSTSYSEQYIPNFKSTPLPDGEQNSYSDTGFSEYESTPFSIDEVEEDSEIPFTVRDIDEEDEIKEHYSQQKEKINTTELDDLQEGWFAEIEEEYNNSDISKPTKTYEIELRKE